MFLPLFIQSFSFFAFFKSRKPLLHLLSGDKFNVLKDQIQMNV